MKRILILLTMTAAPLAAHAEKGGAPFETHRRGYLGVGAVEITPELRQHFGAPKDAGVMIGSVEAGSPAAQAGVRVADIVTAIDGRPVEDSSDLRERVRGHRQGDTVKVELVRAGKIQALDVKVAERDVKELDAWHLYFKGPPGAFRWRGDTSKAVQKAMERLHALRGELPKMERELEEKMKALDERMERLEKRLERSGKTGTRDGV